MKDTSNRLFCLLGDKVDNSLSPVIHNSFFNYYDISGFYIPLNVSQSNLEDIVLLLNKLNFQGANVTIPHKENIIKFLDVLLYIEYFFAFNLDKNLIISKLYS